MVAAALPLSGWERIARASASTGSNDLRQRASASIGPIRFIHLPSLRSRRARCANASCVSKPRLYRGIGLFPQGVDGPGQPRHDQQRAAERRSEEHTSELQSLMRISYAVFCLKKNKKTVTTSHTNYQHAIN